jgi:hypothetical protein
MSSAAQPPPSGPTAPAPDPTGANGVPDPSREKQRPSGLRHPVAWSSHHSEEDTTLAARLTAWVQETAHGESVKSDFMESVVESRLRAYRSWARFWRWLQISAWLLIAVLGLLITVFAGLKTGHAFTIVAGALVATLTTLTNAAHPSKLADDYEDARVALRNEGWDLVTQTGDYAPPQVTDDEVRFTKFKNKVTAIVAAKRANTKLDALGAS